MDMNTVQSFAGGIPQRERIILKHLVMTVPLSVALGMVAGVTSTLWAPVSLGPLIPYFCGSLFGFSFGTLHFWKNENNEATKLVRSYPSLIYHHLDYSFPGICTMTDLKNPLSLTVSQLSHIILVKGDVLEQVQAIRQNVAERMVENYSVQDGNYT